MHKKVKSANSSEEQAGWCCGIIKAIINNDVVIKLESKIIIFGQHDQLAAVGDYVQVLGYLNDEEQYCVERWRTDEEMFCGLVTSLETDSVTVDYNIRVEKRAISGPKDALKQGTGIEGFCIKTFGQVWAYRAVTACMMTESTTSALFPNLLNLQIAKQKALENKNSISLTDTVINITCTPDQLTNSFVIPFTNLSSLLTHSLEYIRVDSTTPRADTICKVISPDPFRTTTVYPLQTIDVIIQIEPVDFPSILTEYVVLNFNLFEIQVMVQIVAGDELFCRRFSDSVQRDDYLDLNALYRTYKEAMLAKNFHLKNRTKHGFKMPHFIPPPSIEQLLMLNEHNWQSEIDKHYDFLLDPASPLNYQRRFDVLLWIHEIFLAKLNRKLDRNGVVLEQHGDFYVLHFEGVNEIRPVVMAGNYVVCSVEGGRSFKGMLVKVLINKILIEMDSRFDKHRLCETDVQFKQNTLAMNIQHSVLQGIMDTHQAFIFPNPDSVKKPPVLDVEIDKKLNLSLKTGKTTHTLHLTNPQLNITQLTAIKNVLRGERRPTPYLICGPPGTGKTTTLVEIIVQLMTCKPTANILVCTQSNTAANLVLTRLLQTNRLNTKEIVRVLSLSVMDKHSMPPELLEYCAILRKQSIDDEVEESSISKENILSKRLVIITCGSVGYFTLLDLPQTHFTHLIMDEAAQCFETECIVPLKLIDRENGQLILAGDEKQLGPVTFLEALSHYKYDLSLFERLLQSSQSDTTNILNNNYRSAPLILKLFNDLFYNSRLQPMITNAYNPLLDLVPCIAPPNPLRSPMQSVFFYNVIGMERQCSTDVSWINTQEIEVVVYLYFSLIKGGVRPKDIGIISPYQGQVRALKHIMTQSRVGSVHEFQGQEQNVIILSTVRSNLANLEIEKDCSFIMHRKQINVALSRARFLLLIVGNGSLLYKDRTTWRRVIHFTTSRHAFVEMERF